ncbi:hypothetical protein MVEN_00105800 [Mycena venus]|uniref:Uncharacterized protein n=1 Tax=Mycena venus TaxID=2733690 RepID=A0A8H7DFH3_9AGAR|nr:hypothetical protein MVEN_00105800 [Mycena venus]
MATGGDLLPNAGDPWDTNTALPNFDVGEETEYTCEGKSSLGRATLFGSEAPNAVREFWMKLFPTKAIVKMLCNDPDEYRRTYFDQVALPVDVFHFKSKHKETNIDCGANSEQANAWFGGSQSIVREMPVERYTPRRSKAGNQVEFQITGC